MRRDGRRMGGGFGGERPEGAPEGERPEACVRAKFERKTRRVSGVAEQQIVRWPTATAQTTRKVPKGFNRFPATGAPGTRLIHQCAH